MISKLLLLVIGVVGLFFGGWAGYLALQDTTIVLSSLGMMGYIFQFSVIAMSLTLAVEVRRKLTLLLLVWHMPEAILIATLGMGVPDDTRIAGVAIHLGFSILALLAWYLDKMQPVNSQ